jgi:hypothetical protein
VAGPRVSEGNRDAEGVDDHVEAIVIVN